MRIAITGGTGFVGGHLAARLSARGHQVVLVARGVDRRPWAHEVRGLPGVISIQAGLGDERGLAGAFEGCDAVAHCAGIDHEIGLQTYEAVHVRGTEHVVRAAEESGVRRLAYVSFLRARPDCGSAFHESKWAAEEIVRGSGCGWTVVKPGVMFGRGDHLLDHLGRALATFPVVPGIGPRRFRPLAVGDAVSVLEASLVDGRLTSQTVGIVGPTEIEFDDAARLVAAEIGRRRPLVPVPLAVHSLLARACERTMTVPLITTAQVRILREGMIEPVRAPDGLPVDLAPTTRFDGASIRAGIRDPGPLALGDLRMVAGAARMGGPGAVLVFDGDCGFCTASAAWAARQFHHGERAEAWKRLGADYLDQHGLSLGDVAGAAWWVDDLGTRERGERAIARALLAGGRRRRLLGHLLLVPPVSCIAAGLYPLVVRWRHRLPGSTPACKVEAAGPPDG